MTDVDTGLAVFAILTAGACGLMGGAFYAFSSFTMAGLGRLPQEQGIAAMQSINVTAVAFPFMLGFFGTAALSLALIIWAATQWQGTPSILLIAGAALYLTGIFFLTMAFHVPRNDRLAAVEPASTKGGEVWDDYLVVWTRGNHIRTLAGLGASWCIMAALVV